MKRKKAKRKPFVWPDLPAQFPAEVERAAANFPALTHEAHVRIAETVLVAKAEFYRDMARTGMTPAEADQYLNEQLSNPEGREELRRMLKNLPEFKALLFGPN